MSAMGNHFVPTPLIQTKHCLVRRKLHRFTITDLLTLPQWTDATFSVGGGAACTHRLKPLPGIQQRGSQIFSQVMRTERSVVRPYGDNTDKPTQSMCLTHIFIANISAGSITTHQPLIDDVHE